MITIDGVAVHVDSPVVAAEGTQFPRGFFTTPEALALAAAKVTLDPVYPNPHFYTWTINSDYSLTVVPKDLDEVKAYLKSCVKDIRDERMESAGFAVLSGGRTWWFHSDTGSRNQQLGNERLAAKATAAGFPSSYVLQDRNGVDINWKTMSGEFVLMTVQLAENVFYTSLQSDIDIFNAAVKHNEAIAVLSTVEELEAYVYITGWPLSFEESKLQPAI